MYIIDIINYFRYMTQDEIKKNNKKIRRMNKRNEKKLSIYRIIK